MSASTKLSNSVKALCCLANHPTEPQSSAAISLQTGVNASKIRRLLADLAKIGVVSSTQGTAGGFLLARQPSEIHLQEIYCAIEGRKAFHLGVTMQKDSMQLPDRAAVNQYFRRLFSEIQVEIEDKMSKITLADIINNIS